MVATSQTPPRTVKAVFQTNLPLPDRRQGKVRDIYTVPAGAGQPKRVLIVASDRISAFDVVMPTPIPGKGQILTDISTRWFDLIRPMRIGNIADHVISTDPNNVPGLNDEQRQMIESRMMLCLAAEIVPIEFVVRGYLAGSGWVEYQQSQTVCGIKLPAGLKQCDKLPQPIFTPATKASVGHDENIDFDRACEIAGRDVMEQLRDVSIAIYNAGAKHAESRGIILADTKFEFGYAIPLAEPGAKGTAISASTKPLSPGSARGELLLVDEILTPDSSRFWPADKYQPGRDQESFDKQYLRNYLQDLVKAGQWKKQPPGPELPDTVVRNTAAKYEEARERLFG